jgi:hypothetical protein
MKYETALRGKIDISHMAESYSNTEFLLGTSILRLYSRLFKTKSIRYILLHCKTRSIRYILLHNPIKKGGKE